VEHKGFVRGRLLASFRTSNSNPSHRHTVLHMVKTVWNRDTDHPIYEALCGQQPFSPEFLEQAPKGSRICRSCQRQLNAATTKDDKRQVRHKLREWRNTLSDWRNGDLAAEESLVRAIREAFQERELHDSTTMGDFLISIVTTRYVPIPARNPYYRFAQKLLDAMFQAKVLKRDSMGWYLLAGTS